MSSFVLKIIACISMFCDHLGYVIYNGNSSFYNLIGRIAFPLFAFQATIGYSHTKNLKKYLIRLFVFALISQIPFILFYKLMFVNGFRINILFTIFLGLLVIYFYDKISKILGLIFGIFVAMFAQTFHFDYGAYGIIIIMIFYLFRNKKSLMYLSFIFASLINYIIKAINANVFPDIFFTSVFYNLQVIFTCSSILLIQFYNNTKGKSFKYLFYIFYPLHLLILSFSYIYVAFSSFPF